MNVEMSKESRTVEVERVSVISPRPFDAVVDALESAIGHPDLAELRQIAEGAGSFSELESVVEHALGRTGLMLFLKLDLGAVLRKESGRDRPRMVRLLIGNPLIMKEMTKHTPEAGSYATVTVLLDERPEGVHLSYDRMASLLAPYGNEESLAVARTLDLKIESLLHEAAAA
jgi:uncharacterized protein (DUF302 family)